VLRVFLFGTRTERDVYKYLLADCDHTLKNFSNSKFFRTFQDKMMSSEIPST